MSLFASAFIRECALDAKADVLVTGNRRDLRVSGGLRGIEVLTPREFLEMRFPSGLRPR